MIARQLKQIKQLIDTVKSTFLIGNRIAGTALDKSFAAFGHALYNFGKVPMAEIRPHLF